MIFPRTSFMLNYSKPSDRTHTGRGCSWRLVCMQLVEAQIVESQEELERSKIYKQHQEEYEVLKAGVVQLPPRAETEAAIAKVMADTEDLRKESAQLDRDIAVRCLRRMIFSQPGMASRCIARHV